MIFRIKSIEHEGKVGILVISIIIVIIIIAIVRAEDKVKIKIKIKIEKILRVLPSDQFK